MKLIRPQLLQVAGVAVVALCVNAPSRGAEPNVVGNWKLVSYVSEELGPERRRLRWASTRRAISSTLLRAA